MEILLLILAVVGVGMLASWFVSAPVVRQIERGVVFRLGGPRGRYAHPL